jgi:hypothetical protein
MGQTGQELGAFGYRLDTKIGKHRPEGPYPPCPRRRVLRADAAAQDAFLLKKCLQARTPEAVNVDFYCSASSFERANR